MDLLQYLRHGKINPAKTAGLDPSTVPGQAQQAGQAFMAQAQVIDAQGRQAQ